MKIICLFIGHRWSDFRIIGRTARKCVRCKTKQKLYRDKWYDAV